jgi:hypothetical protein
MSSTSLEKVIEEVRALTVEEQRKVRELINSLLEAPAEESRELSPQDLLQRRMLERGAISEIPRRDASQYEDFEPVEVKGKPLSEIIIEDRR